MEKRLLICVNRRLTHGNPSCGQQQSVKLAQQLEELIARERLAISVERVFCLGRCNEGPVLRLAPAGEFLVGMKADELMERIRAFAAPTAQQSDTGTTAEQAP